MQKQAYPSYEVIDEKYGFTGRWFEKEINGEPHWVTVNDGSEIYFMTENTDCINVIFTVITTGKTPYFAYSIDGSEPVRQLITEPEVMLPDANPHTVRIITDGLTEGEGKWSKEKGFAFSGISVTEGTVTGIQPVNKVIAFYGDSITEGIRALNMNADSDGNSASNSYPFFCCEALEAIPYNVGYGATGIVSVGSFNTCIKAIDNMTETRPVPDSFVPDVIVINHGTNDSNVPSDVFAPGYNEVVERLHVKYPEARIFALVPFAQSHAADIRAVAEQHSDYITLVSTSAWNITYTDSVHPDSDGAREAGERLANAILDTLGEDFFTVN